MQWLDNIKKAVKGWMQRTGADTGVAREFRSIFEVGGVPAFSQFYDVGVFLWKHLYKGFYTPWHKIRAPTIENPQAKRTMERMDIPKAVCAELASLVWGQGVEISVTRKGVKLEDGSADPLDEFIAHVLKGNAFHTKMQEHIEQMLALGGGALKVWHTDGPNDGELRIGYAMADQFIPLAWDNARVTEGVFISRQAKDGYYYTRLEWHRRRGEVYTIDNELYRADMQKKADGSGEPQDILGYRYPLAYLYPDLQEHVEIPVTHALFSYYRTPIANNLDDNSPLGVSLYANALGTLRALDIVFDGFVQEFRLGKKRIIVPERCIRTVVDPQTNQMRRYFDPTDEVYVAFNTKTPNDETFKIQDNSVELRVEEHVAALNAFLSILCLQLGFSPGTFTFDQKEGLKTATEVVSENSKTYKTICSVQNMLRPALEALVDNIIAVAGLYDMRWKGQLISTLAAGGYEICIVFDDGVTQDRTANLQEGVMLVGAGLLSKFTFLTDRRYGQGLTEEQARLELERINAEQRAAITIPDLDALKG